MKKSKRQLAVEIIRRLRDKGFEAYFVGGCVRDLVLKKTPHDFDIATSALPTDIEAIFSHVIPVGKAFGVMIVRHHHTSFEVATFRKDSVYVDGRRPQSVTYSDAKEDALRRDFTINGLFYDPLKRKILDWVGGVQDAKAKIIRTIGVAKDRFEEDHLRLLRAIRFACNLDFEISDDIRQQFPLMAPAIKKISFERIKEELVKMLVGRHPDRAVQELLESRLLEQILPETARYLASQDSLNLLLKSLRSMQNTPSAAKAFAFLLLGLDDAVFEKAVRDLRFSNKEQEAIAQCRTAPIRFNNIHQKSKSEVKRLLRSEFIQEEMEFFRIYCEVHEKNVEPARLLEQKYRLYKHELSPKPLLTGKDLLEMGISPGKSLGNLLYQLETQQLEGHLQTKRQALDWVRKNSPAS